MRGRNCVTLVLRRTITCAAALALGGCGFFQDLLGEEDTDIVDLEAGAQPAADDGDAPPTPADVGAAAPEPEPRRPLKRSDKKYPFPAKGGSNMGFRVDTLAGHYALAGTPEAPEWSAEHKGDPALTRDDDLDTAWACTPQGENRCALGIHLTRSSTLKGIRLFAAGGSETESYEKFPRPKRLRIHTDEGFLDALLPDDNSHVYAVFGKEITTLNLTLEIVEVWPGRTSEIRFGEIEVYGRTGAPREPLAIDPARTYVKIEPPIWRKGGRDTYDRREAFVHWVDDEGESHRLVAGTTIRGRAGDRFHLVERLQSVTACDAPRGTYYLFDTKTRMVAPLGELGGIGGDAFRASDGNGIAVGYAGKLRTVLDGLFATGSKYHRKRTPIREDKRTENFVAQWGLDAEPLQRGAVPLAKACKVATEAEIATLASARAAAPAATPKRKKRRGKAKAKEPERPEAWGICALEGGAHAYMTDKGPCGSGWEIHVLGKDGAIVQSVVQAREGSHLGLSDLGKGTWLVEIAGKSDSVDLLKVTAKGVTEFASSAAIALNPPGNCRDICNAGFKNPHAPTW